MQFSYPSTVSVFAFAAAVALSQDISCYEKGEGLCVRDAPHSTFSPSNLHGNLVRHEGDGDEDSSVSSIFPNTETGTIHHTVTVHHTMTMHHNCSCSAAPRSSTRPSDTPVTKEPASSVSRSITHGTVAPFKPRPTEIYSGTSTSPTPTPTPTLTKRAENHYSEVAEIPNPTVFAQASQSTITKPGDTFLGMPRITAIGAFVGIILFAVLLLASLIYCAIDRRRIKKRAERSEAKSRAISSGRTLYAEP